MATSMHTGSRRGRRRHGSAPVELFVGRRGLLRRGWIKASESIDELEAEVCKFLGIDRIDDQPAVEACFRQGESRTPEESATLAWLKRVEHLAKAESAPVFNRTKLASLVPKLLALSQTPERIPEAFKTLRTSGVVVVLVDHLPKTYVDGVAFLLENGRGVIGLSVRYNRIDYFWFTLMHEVAHLVLGHKGRNVDVRLMDAEHPVSSKDEREANERATEWLVPASKLGELQPPLSGAKIEHFAGSIGRHAGIVVGQLQYRKRLRYDQHAPKKVKVRQYLEPLFQ